MIPDESAPLRARTGRPLAPRRTVAGVWALVVALVALAALTFLPTGYVIQQPGPVYNTIGSAVDGDGEDVPLISVDGAETYETGGALDLTTVQVVGNRDRTPSWFELALAWLDASRAVVPIDAVFPEGQTTEQREEQNTALMVDSQGEATAAALTQLGYDVGAQLQVVGPTDDESPAEGIVQEGDLILAADGEAVTDIDRLKAIVNEGAGDPVTLTIERDGEDQDVEITPEESDVDGTTTWLIGVYLTTAFDFPIDVTIQLDDVGGPSAGTMFALGIIDTLTPGELTGGEQIAGTGTIDAEGTVGAIGGIRQKLYGARDAGADWFLAPASNCDEAVGHVPDGLRVFSIGTLDDALTTVEAIAEGDTSELPTCAAG
ncbi:PDZ domain-containing protein [Microbacterium betulae]|uniref:endopeptidase La n=1 Tax=Microbacterium betulae TaxID=2981139 RepID=A0AA97FKZ0_9MICO|nr:PDZ domain-containing protein [Microbacterium sp. AB]WOF24723.1 PDZ domain-containing protein [Microbacterium sp. AB]